MTLLASAEVAAVIAAASQPARGAPWLYADELPEALDVLEVGPAVSYERGASAPEYCLDDTLAASKISISINVWAKTRSLANQVADAITLAMQLDAMAQTDRQAVFNDTVREYGVFMQFDVWEV